MNHYRGMLILVLMIALPALAAGLALAQEEPAPEADRRSEDVDPTPQPPYPYTPSYGLDKPAFFNFMWQSGLGLDANDIKIKYRNVPDRLPNDFDAEGNGPLDLHQASFWFYPAKGRQFMISVAFGGGSTVGRFAADHEDADFLDGKEFWRSYMQVPVGLGYRWFAGDNQRVSIELLGQGQFYYSSLHMEGAQDSLSLSGGGLGGFFGTHYRYDNGFLLGGGIDLKIYQAHQNSTKLVGELVDVDLSGGMVVFSILLGWEPWCYNCRR